MRVWKFSKLIWIVGLISVAGLSSCSQNISQTPAQSESQESGEMTAGRQLARQLVSTSEEIIGSDEWDDYSHGKSTDPDYEVVFPQDEVNTINITINPTNWQIMQDNMTELLGEFGTGQGGGMGGGPGQRPGAADGELPEGFEPPTDGELPEGFEPPAGGMGDGPGQRPDAADGELPEGFEPPADGELPEGFEPPAEGMGGGPGQWPGAADGELPEGFEPPAGGMGGGPGGAGGGLDMLRENPMWVPADIEFDGQTWSNVGMRFKGNSSLTSAWSSGILKLGFKLDFDEFEDDYPEIENQRFYGFKQLSFSSNFGDSSLLREKVAADLFREAGIPASQTAFYAVYVDYGEGPIYFGLYTVVEVVDDTVIETQFSDDSGNVYKPEATFAEGTFNEESFDKETNEDEADYSDVLALYEALNADTRTTDPEVWRSDLEAVFNADEFIHWLAVNTVIQNWDTYGQMAHNYYLYNDPDTGQLTWIPWDNNFALMSGMGGMGGGRGGPGGGGQMPDADQAMDNGQMPGGGGTPGGANTTSLDHESVGENWPLIRYLMDDPVYHELYVSYVEDTITNVFVPEEMAERYTELHDLIAPYLVGENGEIEGYTYLNSDEAFETALTELIDHAYSRFTLAEEYLSTQAASQ